MLSRHDARPFRVAASAAVALVAFALSQASLAQAPAAPTVPDEAPPSAVERWSDELWDAARRGERSKVDNLLDNVPVDAASAAAKRLKDAVAARDGHLADTARKVAEQRTEKTKEMDEAVAKGNAVPALVGAAYVKFLSEDWKKDIASPGVQAAIKLADRRIDEARAAGDWLFAEELLNRVRSLYEGSGDKAAYQRYDDALETDISRRVVLVLNYAPRAWYDLRKKQYDRLDEKDRKEPFAPFNEKGLDDWKQALEGINDRILSEALSQIAAQHLENVGWKPLLEGGLRLPAPPLPQHLLAQAGQRMLQGEAHVQIGAGLGQAQPVGIQGRAQRLHQLGEGLPFRKRMGAGGAGVTSDEALPLLPQGGDDLRQVDRRPIQHHPVHAARPCSLKIPSNNTVLR
jgi:hypothetical protein